jgi:hypothetical protein
MKRLRQFELYANLRNARFIRNRFRKDRIPKIFCKRRRFAPILQHYDPTLFILVRSETDASNAALATISLRMASYCIILAEIYRNRKTLSHI